MLCDLNTLRDHTLYIILFLYHNKQINRNIVFVKEFDVDI